MLLLRASGRGISFRSTERSKIMKKKLLVFSSSSFCFVSVRSLSLTAPQRELLFLLSLEIKIKSLFLLSLSLTKRKQQEIFFSPHLLTRTRSCFPLLKKTEEAFICPRVRVVSFSLPSRGKMHQKGDRGRRKPPPLSLSLSASPPRRGRKKPQKKKGQKRRG